MPSRELEDGVDYVPDRPKHVLWGHHYTSIAGAAPIVGPAIAVIWGWLPALLWVALGTVFMGAVHDFAALVISLRHRGRSIGDVAATVIGPRVRTLFLLIISFLIWIVLAVFAFIIGTLFVATRARSSRSTCRSWWRWRSAGWSTGRGSPSSAALAGRPTPC